MYLYRRIINWITRKKDEPGTPCRVLAKSEDKVLILPGRILERKDDGLMISYTWTDAKGHDFITDKDSYIGLNEGLPLYAHNVGQVYQTTTRSLITSDYWNAINNSHVGSQITTDTQELRESGSQLPWKKIIIIGGILILIIVMWQNGTLPDLLDDIIPSTQQSTPVTVPPVEPKTEIVPIEIP